MMNIRLYLLLTSSWKTFPLHVPFCQWNTLCLTLAVVVLAYFFVVATTMLMCTTSKNILQQHWFYCENLRLHTVSRVSRYSTLYVWEYCIQEETWRRTGYSPPSLIRWMQWNREYTKVSNYSYICLCIFISSKHSENKFLMCEGGLFQHGSGNAR